MSRSEPTPDLNPGGKMSEAEPSQELNPGGKVSEAEPSQELKHEYPAFLALGRKKCIVVGGGPVAERKLKDLLKAGADITVISPSLTPTLLRLKISGKIRHKARRFRDSDLDGAFLAIAATNSPETNLKVAKRKDMLLNIADHPELSTFIVPASFRRGLLQVAVSTSSTSPALAREIRKDLEARYCSVFGQYLRKLKGLRDKAMKKIADPNARRKFLRALASAGALKKLLRGQVPKTPEIPEIPEIPEKPEKPSRTKGKKR